MTKTDMAVNLIQKHLFELQDEKYKSFQAKLMPTVELDRIIGVRTPLLRKYASELAKTSEGKEFISVLPHKYYDEYNLHGFIIEKTKDFDEAVELVDAFLPYVDNWATCDLVSPKVFKKNLPALMDKIKEWIVSEHCWTVRFAIEMLMSHFLDENFDKSYATMVSRVVSEEYYVNMMIAWYFATALAKQPKDILPFFEKKILAPWTHNKAIQKCNESYRIPDEIKNYLKTLIVKVPR